MVAALEREVRPLVKEWRVSEKEHAGRRFRFFICTGEKADEVVLVCGGVGAGPARRAAEAVIAIYAPTVVYSVGFAGGLVSALKVGDVVQPSQVIDAGDGSRRREPLAQADQFEESPVELDDMIFGAPGMAIARADLKAEPSKQLRLGVEVAGGNDDVIEGAGQGGSRGRKGAAVVSRYTIPVTF